MYYPEQLCNNYIKQFRRSTSFQRFVEENPMAFNLKKMIHSWWKNGIIYISEAFKTFKYKFVLHIFLLTPGLWGNLKPCFLKKTLLLLCLSCFNVYQLTFVLLKLSFHSCSPSLRTASVKPTKPTACCLSSSVNKRCCAGENLCDR